MIDIEEILNTFKDLYQNTSAGSGLQRDQKYFQQYLDQMRMSTANAQDFTAASYFISKCDSISALRKSVISGVWASRERCLPPQPHQFLAEAFSKGPVILIFSVNNCRGWHGYASMVTAPDGEMKTHQHGNISTNSNCMEFKLNAEQVQALGELEQKENDLTVNNMADCLNPSDVETAAQEQKDEDKKIINCWHQFKIHWHKQFLTEFGETCLSFENTQELVLPGNTPLNKARNWQEVTEDVGRQVCQLLDDRYVTLVAMRLKAQQDKLASYPVPFLAAGAEANRGHEKHWQMVVQKVEQELGRVHLACPFGSQRYNLHHEASDIDAFVVYQAHTQDILSLSPPKATVKNSDRETCDYTILELQRYCELLLLSDARCVETLFLHESTIIQASLEWRQLQQHRLDFLTRKCLDKYLGDALGSNGVRRLERYIRETPSISASSCMPHHIAKLAYIIIRLLQNAEDVVKGRELEVFRKVGTNRHMLLHTIRTSSITLGEINTHIEELVTSIQEKKENIPEEFPSAKASLERWLLSLRFQDFQQFPP